MRKILALAVAVTLVAATSAVAAPLVKYNTVNGNLIVENDGTLPGANAGAIGIVNIKSAAGTLNAPTFPGGAIPGATVDLGDLPNFIALLAVPQGTFKLGPGTVDAQTSVGDISVDFYAAFGQPAIVGQVVPIVPEPATLAMAGLAVVGIVAAARRRA